METTWRCTTKWDDIIEGVAYADYVKEHGKEPNRVSCLSVGLGKMLLKNPDLHQELNDAAKKSFKEMSLANRAEKITETVLKISNLSKTAPTKVPTHGST